MAGPCRKFRRAGVPAVATEWSRLAFARTHPYATHLKRYATAICAVATGCARASHVCASPPIPSGIVQVPPLPAGEYELSVVAECGSRSGVAISDRLFLEPTQLNDRS